MLSRLFGSAERPAHRRLVLVAYDIACPKRWRRVFRIMKDHGDWVQLSIFLCALDDRARRRLDRRLERVIDPEADRVLVADLGPAATGRDNVVTLGRPIEESADGPGIV